MIFDSLYEESVSSLSRAVKSKNIQLLQELLDSGHSPNVTDNRGWTPLHVAASEGCVEAVQCLLLADDIQIDSLSYMGFTPLFMACEGRTDSKRNIVELLLKAGADPDMTDGNVWAFPLLEAATANNLEVMKLLLHDSADPNVIGYMSNTPLHQAALVGSLEIAQLLLDNGADVNHHQENELSALHCLCEHYKQESAATYNSMLDLFLAHSCDVNYQLSGGTTSLMLALRSHWDWGVNRLLDHGADVHLVRSENIIALHAAIEFYPPSPDKSSVESEEKLGISVLEKILRLTSRDRIPREGFTIFNVAITWKRYKTLRMLIDEGIHPDDFLDEFSAPDCEIVESFFREMFIEDYVTTPLGVLLTQDLTQEVVDTVKYMISKGSCVNILKPGILQPLMALLLFHHSDYKEGSLALEILQYLLAEGADIMYKERETDLFPGAITAALCFSHVGLFHLMQHGVPAHCIFTDSTLTTFHQQYSRYITPVRVRQFSWAQLSWLRIANLFVSQLPPDACDILRSDSDEEDEELKLAWQEVETFILSPKSLEQLCVLKVRHMLGEGRGWQRLQHSLKQLQTDIPLPDLIVDLLHFRWVKTDTLWVFCKSSTEGVTESQESDNESMESNEADEQSEENNEDDDQSEESNEADEQSEGSSDNDQSEESNEADDQAEENNEDDDQSEDSDEDSDQSEDSSKDDGQP